MWPSKTFVTPRRATSASGGPPSCARAPVTGPSWVCTIACRLSLSTLPGGGGRLAGPAGGTRRSTGFAPERRSRRVRPPRGCPVRTDGPPSGPDGARSTRPAVDGRAGSGRARAATRRRPPRLPSWRPCRGSTPASRPPTRRTTSSARAGARSCRASAAACGREPGDVDVILPFEEVVAALGRVEERYAGLQTIPLDSVAGHRRPQAGLRPPVPPHDRPRPRALGADRQRDAAGRGDAADQRLPHRRGLLRPRRPPPRVGGAGAGPHGHRRLRRRGRHAGRRRALAARSATCRTKSHERLFHERVPLPAARPRAHARARRLELRHRWPRRSRPGPSAPCRSAAEFWDRRTRGAPLVRGRVRARRRRCCARPTCSATAPRPTPTWRVAAQRYRLLLTHEWSEDVLARLRDATAQLSAVPSRRERTGSPAWPAVSAPPAPAPGRASATRPCAGRTGASCSC